MPKAERKSAPVELAPETSGIPSGSLLDGLNVKPSSSKKKPRKTKADGSPTWHQLHRTYRYYLDDSVYKNVAGVATKLNVENVSSVATVLMSFALVMYDQGKVRIESEPNPNPKSNRMTLVWTYKENGGWPRELKPDASRKQRRARSLIGEKEKIATYGFRWSQELHLRIKKIASQYAVPIGAVTSRLLAYAVDEWISEKLTIDAQTIVSHEVSGWNLK
jgi:hypothetical protein